MTQRFEDRRDGGRAVARALSEYAGRDDVIVLGLPRGGVPVAWEVASALDAPLDLFLVRKLGVPGHEELAMGAIASGGVRIVSDEVMSELGVTDAALAAVAAEEQQELERREREYRGGRAEPLLEGRTVILVDDGLATGSTMKAAAAAVTARSPARVVVAVPVAAREVCAEMEELVDSVVCASNPQPFRAVGYAYEDFTQTTDDEVVALLERAREELPSPG